MFCCEFCNMSFETERKLSSHMWQKHSIEWHKIKKEKESLKVFKCDYCEKFFSTNLGLSQHIGRMHSEQLLKEKSKEIFKYEFVCKKCGYRCKTKHGLKSHIGRYHKVEKFCDYVCEICDRKFETKNGLSTHISKRHSLKMQDYYDLYILKDKKDKYCECKSEKRFINIFEGYDRFCKNRKCKFKKKDTLEKRKRTCLKKYGVDFYAKTEEERKRMSKVISYEGVEKRKQTNLKRFGYESSSSCPDVKKKWKESMRKEGYEKYRNTCLKRYNVDHYSKTKKFKEDFEATCIKKYGVSSPMKDPEIKKRAVTNSYKSLDSKPYSKIANKVFDEIVENFCKSSSNIEVFYKKDEKTFKDKENNIYKYDFVLTKDKKIKVIIDFHGNMFHPKNGKIPNENPFKIDILMATEKDFKRQVFASKNSEKYFVIWEDEWKKDKNRILEDIGKTFKELKIS